MVPPVLKVLTINGLSLVVEGSTLSGETQEGNEEDEDNELTGVADLLHEKNRLTPGLLVCFKIWVTPVFSYVCWAY